MSRFPYYSTTLVNMDTGEVIQTYDPIVAVTGKTWYLSCASSWGVVSGEPEIIVYRTSKPTGSTQRFNASHFPNLSWLPKLTDKGPEADAVRRAIQLRLARAS